MMSRRQRYAFYDSNFQRKSIVNHCTGALGDPRLRNSWSVDINSSYPVGSFFDGYFGTNTKCLSGNFAGTGELFEAESSNVIALAGRTRTSSSG